MKPADTEIIEAYVAFLHAAQKSADYEALFWVFEEMDAICHKEPERGLRLILAVLAKDLSDKAIAALAPGPMEDLLARHGERMIGAVETEARTNPKFAYLLGGVWSSSMPKLVWRKIEVLRSSKW